MLAFIAGVTSLELYRRKALLTLTWLIVVRQLLGRRKMRHPLTKMENAERLLPSFTNTHVGKRDHIAPMMSYLVALLADRRNITTQRQLPLASNRRIMVVPLVSLESRMVLNTHRGLL